MSADYFDQLESELRGAVPRAARRRLRLSVSLPRPHGFGVALAAAVPVAVAALALALLGHRSSPGVRPLSSGSTATSVAAVPARPARALVLRGDGLGQVRFGATGQQVLAALRPRLGRPATLRPGAACGVDHTVYWPIALTRRDDPKTYVLVSIDLDHGRFVGYQVGGRSRHVVQAPRLRPGPVTEVRALATARGLTVGDRLARARRLYGHALRLSNAQGGSWSVRTSHGRIDGFATVDHFPIGLNARVESIDAGRVGCAAATP
jgi:hypothetical protein